VLRYHVLRSDPRPQLFSKYHSQAHALLELLYSGDSYLENEVIWDLLNVIP